MPRRPQANPLPETHANAPCDCRCPCGSLLARVIPDGVELKCRRCKRTLLVRMPDPRRLGFERVRPVERPSPRETA